MNRKKIFQNCVPLVLLLTIFLLSGGITAFAAPDPITGAEPAEGYGANVTGGYGKTVVNVTTWTEFANAIKLNDRYIRIQNDLTAASSATIGSGTNITIDGQGIATIWGTGTPGNRGQRAVELMGKNVVVKDLRIRNSGDNLSFKSPGENILVSHVSVTGAYDDGMSISYGTKNITVQYCVFFGNTRSVFIKYDGPQYISFHHNWIKGQYMRGPLVSTAYNVDIRNYLLEDWWSWGGPRFESGASGNCINSTFVMTGAASGKTDGCVYGYSSPGPIYQSGNAFRGCSGRPETFTSSTPIAHAPVNTETAAASETNVRANAGCLPRDAIDQLYISTASGWGRSPFTSMNDTNPWIIPSTTVTGPASPTTTSPIVFTINFGRAVTGFSAAGITVTNGTKGAFSGSGAGPYTLQVTPSGTGVVVTCKVNAGVAAVATEVTRAGTYNAESNTLSINFGGSVVEAPTATVSGPASPTSSSPITFNIAFSKPVTGFTAAGITVTNGTKGTLTGSGASYSIPVSPLAPGPVTCKVNTGAAQDGEGTPNVESNTLNVTYEAPDIPDDLPTWAHRIPLRFTGYTGSETLTSFPLLVRLNAAQFPPAEFEPGGADLRFTDAADHPLPYEIEAWDRDGESSIWVTVPQITSNTDYIQMLWGKPGALSRARPHRVWTNGFHGVWHLGDLDDSTAAERHATNNGTTTEEGIIGGGLDFDGASFVALPPVGTSTAGSLSVWIKSSAVLANRTLIFYLRGAGGSSNPEGNGDGYGGQNEIHVDFITNDSTNYLLNFFLEGGSTAGNVDDVYITDTRAYNDGQWHHIAATWAKPGNCNLYVNGALIGSTEHIGFEFDVNRFVALGKPETLNRYYTGLMDEARLCSVPRSAAWIEASYLNQKRDSTFIEYGGGAPLATVTGPAAATKNSPIVFTINFSKPVTGLTAGGITVANGTKGTLTGSGAGPYSMPVTPTAQGAVTCQVNAGAAQDGDSNPNPISNLASVVYDSVAPTATVTGPASPTSTSPIVFTINFSEPVTGLTAGGITVTNGTKGTLAGSGAGPYTLSVTPSASGAVTCQVNAGAAQDAATNGNTASNIESVTYSPEGEGAGAQGWFIY